MLFFIQATPFGTGTYLNLTLPYFLSVKPAGNVKVAITLANPK